MEAEQAPFLPPEEKGPDAEDAYSQPRPRKQRRWYRPWIISCLIHGGLIAIYTIASIFIIKSQRCIAYLPPAAIDGLQTIYTPTLFHRLNATPYAGPPSPELDAAWDALLAPMHISVSAEELERDNQKSVALPESGGYLGWMGVFHELHCIRMLREWNYRSYYHDASSSSSNLSAAEAAHLEQHVDHCFEMLRQSAVCHADASLTTFVWHPEKTRPMFNASESVHRCVDWELLMDSVKDRVVDEEEILRLKNPLMHAV
ncbi:MAG: hypothetical protein Q9191_003430 [Dirinaria sp. TL-2023a]